ncbi:MAG: hypothetical protein B9S34_13395 [Opitutia bacterium Tous-C1TDCM]|nr:MAG: hypothetical protein B9S34_13395 [Opitutae bacterium Tous-C1TDCM]
MRSPPLLPEETLVRVLRLAKLDGITVLVLGGVFALMAAGNGQAPFAIVGLLAAGAGAIELHGVGLLRRNLPAGMPWVFASQPLLLLVIFGYCALRLTHFEMPPIPDSLREAAAANAQALGMTLEDYFRVMNRVSAGLVAAIACAYQGWMAFYYWNRRRAVAQALDTVVFETEE